MIVYDDTMDEMLFDSAKDSIMVIDVDCQGLCNLSAVGDRLRVEFPLTFAKYARCCIEGGRLGEVLESEERGYKLALMFTTLNRVGESKDSGDTVKMFTLQCIERLIKGKLLTQKFSSGILNRHTATWGQVCEYIKASDISWTVHRN